MRALAAGARLVERSLDDMTLPQFRVLGVVATSPERASRVAMRAAVSRPSLSGVLDGLVGKGWVTRSDVRGDRRGVHLAVTAEGDRALGTAGTAAATALWDVLDDVAPDDREAVLRGLALLARAFETRAARRVAAPEAR